ncbi:MAG: hypothetical protein HY473_00640 [Candidatus Sungbacteria bacterium]|uniref:Uncharacterized protein n=1 Tax=Candidatus Sungiibacteriota bacterium TaxID=2750080 RepID=A0A933DRW9_9BACT|nr:hypothetical protein [Candidatus Sungbacteria bacterium]
MEIREEKEYFQKSFKAREYLQNYYSHIDVRLIRQYVLQRTAASETARIMIHLAEVAVPTIQSIFRKQQPTLLELGGGPTLYQLFSVAPLVKQVHFTDYTEDNLREIIRWVQKERGAFDWRPYALVALMLKNDSPKASNREVKNLEQTLREKITKIAHCDIFRRGLGLERRYYDIISTHFVAESATSSKAVWRKAIRNISAKLSSGGLLIMSALRGARGSYKVLDKRFPAVQIYESDLYRELRKNRLGKIRFSTMKTEDLGNNYRGFIFIIAEKD